MKKYIAIVLAAVAAVACQKEINGPEAARGVFTATMETCDETKTFTDGSLQVKWSENDYLNIWDHTSLADKYTISSASVGKNTADLEIVEAGTSSETVNALAANIGYYPYSKDITCTQNGSSYKLGNISLSATQRYAEGSFGNGSQPMVAVTRNEDDHALAFRNVCGVLRILLTGEMAVNSISVTGNNGEVLCGTAEISASNTAMPAITMTGDGKTVTLDCGNGVQLDGTTETSFDIVLPPVTFEKGFTVKVNDKAYFSTDKTKSIRRSHILRMNNRTVDGDITMDAVDLGLSVKWASCNLGATTPADFGQYFAWGEISPKTTFSWDNYRYGSKGNFTKYNATDKLTELQPEDDAAAVLLGGEWRMPSHKEELELAEKCTWVRKAINGINGYEITGPNGNSIFMPFGGLYDPTNYGTESSVYRANSAGWYWSSTLNGTGSSCAQGLCFYPDILKDVSDHERCDGHTIRPVYGSSIGEDLSKEGSANCYIVSSSGKYRIHTVKGNSSDTVGAVASAEVLWESYGTETAPAVGDLVSEASYADGYITFIASDKKGNAVIAAKDADGKILWSWHIWMTDQPEDQVYNNNAGSMMDRNLGATSATKGDVHALGLLYQWGRKDPFLSGNGISSNTRAASTITWPSVVSSNASNGTIAYAIANPTTVITQNSSNQDWYYTGSSSVDNTRWQTSDKDKGLYDPCPAGYRVPDGGESGVWSNAFGASSNWTTASNWDNTNKGIDFGLTDKTLGIGTIWYPFSGYIDISSGKLNNVGKSGHSWSATPHDGDSYAYCLYMYCNGGIISSNYIGRSIGRPVRCFKEGSVNKDQVAVTGVSLNKSTMSIIVGGSETLTATITPSDATNKSLTWSSSNTSVATVDSNGKVTGVKQGSAIITVKTADGGKTATCSVTVESNTVSVTGVSLNNSSMQLYVGSTATLVATVKPDGADNKAVSWSSSDESIATVSTDGLVNGVKIGTAVITVKTQDGGFTATCQVTVKASSYSSTDGDVVTLQSGIDGLDLVIMGDGFIEDDLKDGTYDRIMRQAADEFFDEEPLKTLKKDFNVFYVNAVSPERTNATNTGSNGATNSGTTTKFSCQFTANSTKLTGDNDLAREYAKKAFTSNADTRITNATVVVMVNQACRAGTCHSTYNPYSDKDFGASSSVAYCALGRSDAERQAIMKHEICGHGFGKLADEYYYSTSGSLSTSLWTELNNLHKIGLYRNVDKYIDSNLLSQLGDGYELTTTSNVYWHDLFGTSNNYESSSVESLGVFKGGYTYSFMFCRPTQDGSKSIMNSDGSYFNAISRRQIYYRYLRLSGKVTSNTYGTAEELNRFLTFDATYCIPSIVKTASASVQKKVSMVQNEADYIHSHTPVILVAGEWKNGKFIPYKK